MPKGKVYIIGAGPGDEELITVKAVRKLKECTAVLYDRLIGKEILKHLNETCKIYYCGKEPGCHYKTQNEINDMLVELAKEGNIVGRIKGGDPYIFGRGSEEALRFSKEGIEFEVLSGITSPVAVLNYAGIPVTHRNISRSFHVFTAKTADDYAINFKAAAELQGTLIFLMGFEKLKEITEGLIENGMNALTPCAVVMRGTTSFQKKAVGKLLNISEKCKLNGIKSPCIIVVGEVVNFSEELNWYEKKPLFGRNICITRAKKQSKEMHEKLLDLGAEVTEINSIEIKNTAENLKAYIKNLQDYDYIVLTSVNAVEILFDYLSSQAYDIRKIKAEFAVIGNATKEALKKRGILAKIVSRKHNGHDLFDELKKVISKDKSVFIPRSKNSREYIKVELEKLGVKVDECFIYETVPGEIYNKNAFDDVDTVIFTSPSTVRNMISMVGIEKIKSKKIIAIGHITGSELEKVGAQYSIPNECSTEGIIKECLINE
ncbi:uroporphyrinogen-III C-methyltransferase [Clostridium neuense]|uniref:uroporphyrinogen-III C-methyltransferase n=1 Tax=Clostridium neuense TaxID=1728934 RepID=A0ABW8TIM6_9CLOT